MLDNTCGECFHWAEADREIRTNAPGIQKPGIDLSAPKIGQCRYELKVVPILTPQGSQVLSMYPNVPSHNPSCSHFKADDGECSGSCAGLKKKLQI